MDIAEEDIEEDLVYTHIYCGRVCSKWSSILILILIMNMYDVVSRFPMTYRNSPIRCTMVVVVVDIEHLPS